MKHLNIRICLVIITVMTSVGVSSSKVVQNEDDFEDQVFEVVVENRDGIGINYNCYKDKYIAYVKTISSLPSSIAENEYFELNIPESFSFNGNEYSVIGIQGIGSGYGSFISKIYIPLSIKDILCKFGSNLNTIIFENINLNFHDSFYYCKLQNVIIKNLDDEGVSGRFGKWDYNSEGFFNENALRHATLYVPSGTWSEFAYRTLTTGAYPGWSNFIHIREMAMETEELSESRAYTLLDTKSFNYYVYDVVNNRITSRGSHSNFDESNPNNSWQIIKIDNSFALYNIGAKRYATFTTNGELELSIVPSILPMEDASNGIAVGNSQFGFVLNENVNIDQSVTSIGKKVIKEKSIAKYYTIDGRNSDVPHKGLNIVRMNNGETKKILVK